MLLPSDVARLVLGYLQHEGLRATSQAFILESPNLKEYAEHSTEDGTIPACVFSLFGKSLTTILNEYVAVKTKETSQETQIPAMMTSLWKKLEFTLNQIKCMQNSPAIQQNQRLRTRTGIMNLRRQRALTSPQSPLSRLPSAATGHYVSPSNSTPEAVLGHSTQVCFSSPQTRPSPLCISQPQVQDGGRLVINVNRDSPLQVIVPDHRINPGPLSPGRRKCDSPRRRGGGLSGSCGPGRANVLSSVPPTELHSESYQETVGEYFPQMVIENAREKILNDKSLQEKLAENINKILGSDISPQSTKLASCSTVEQDQSIDEILGLQGEIHMTDDAIQDILEQTESDPAFQALFDLFEYGKDRSCDGEHQEDGRVGNASPDCVEGEQSDCSLVTAYQGIGTEDSAPGTEASRKAKTKKAQELKAKKARKTAHPLPSTSRAAQPSQPARPFSDTRAHSQEQMDAAERLVVCDDRRSRPLQAAVQSSIISDNCVSVKESDASGSLMADDDVGLPVEERSGAAESESAAGFCLQPQIQQQSPGIAKDHCGPLSQPVAECEENTSEALDPAGATPGSVHSLVEAEGPVLGVPLEVPSGSQQHSGSPISRSVSEASSEIANDQKADVMRSPSPQKSPSLLGQTQDSEAPTLEFPPNPAASTASASETSPLLFSAPAASPPATLSAIKETDASKIVSLKIIISDEQDEQPGDLALSQAVSSITGERIPTIILSSPAKTPSKALAGTGPSLTVEETVQAVSCLQSTELNSLAGKPAEAMISIDESMQLSLASELVPENGFIQLLPSTSSYGGSSSYLIVADPAVVGHQSSVMVLPGAAPLGHMAGPASLLATPPRARPVSISQDAAKACSPGSTLIISSPVQPVLQSIMVPASVVGQKNTGSFTIVSNQLLTLPVPSAKVIASSKSKPKLAPKDPAVSGKTSGMGVATKPDMQIRPCGPSQSSQDFGQPALTDGTAVGATLASSSPSHRRILCFDTDSPGSADPTPPTKSTLSPSLSHSLAPTVAFVAPAGQTTEDSPCGHGSRGPKIRSVQPAILRNSRASRADLARGAKEARKPESEKNCADGPSDDAKERTCADSDAGHAAEAQGPAASTAPTPLDSAATRAQQGEDKKAVPVASTAKEVSESPRLSVADQKSKSKAAGAPKEELRSRADAAEKCQVKGRDGKEGRAERRSSSMESPHVTANKENEMEVGSRREHHPAMPAPPGEPVQPRAGCPAPAAQVGSCKAPSKTSPLTKQAAEMLQEIQGLNPTSTPSKRSGLTCPELALPRTPGLLSPAEEPPDSLRTPIRQQHCRERDGTPRHVIATPDAPTCSPASEAGSESSINMAAQTLISLSRAGRGSTPLKDSVLQQGTAASNITTVSPKAKKRKQVESHTTSNAKKELQLSSPAGSKKKAKKRKRFLDSFPDDLDVDKFLSSLHYDE